MMKTQKKRRTTGYALKRKLNQVPYIYSSETRELCSLLRDPTAKESELNAARKRHDQMVQRIHDQAATGKVPSKFLRQGRRGRNT